MISLNRNKIKGKKGSPLRQLEDSPSNTRFTTALANLILAISSGWALGKLNTLAVTVYLPGEELISWSKVPFYLALLHAVVSIMTFSNPKYGTNIRWLHLLTALVCVFVGLPCFMFQLACQHRVPLQSLTLIVGGAAFAGITFQVLQQNHQAWHNSLMTTVVLACLMSITLISYIHCNYYGLSAVFAYSINYFVIGMTGTAFNLPAIDLYSYGYVFFNYFAVKAILD